MKSLLNIAAIGFIAFFGLGRFERGMIWPLDPTYVSPEHAGVTAQEHRMVMRDRTEVIIWTTPPAAGKATILYFHGNGGNFANRAWRYQWFIDRGYGLVAMSYRGSSGSAGTAVERKILSDAREVWDQISQLIGSHDNPVLIYGESIGGAVGTGLAEGLQDNPRLAGLILEAPFTSIPDMIRQEFPQFRHLLFALKNRFPTEDRIRNITTPLLVLHGTDDRVIPFRMGQAVFQAAASPDKQFIEIPGGGHDNTWQTNPVARLEQFLSGAVTSATED